MARIFTDDIQKLANETGLTYDEALSLLRRANGDYRRALRMHQESFTVYVEPDRVEDSPNQAKAHALHLLKGLTSLLRRMAGSAALRRAIVLIIIMFALTSAPHISGCALLIFLFIRLAASRFDCASPAA